MKRRARADLESAVAKAEGRSDRALARYHLAVFHDNNGREAAAIPHYRAALKLGLDAKTKAAALAWLASSLHKTGHTQEAMRQASAAERLSKNRRLNRFLAGLKRRIERNS